MKSAFYIVFLRAVTIAALGVENPFLVSADLTSGDAGADVVEVRFDIAPGHYIYAESVKVAAGGGIELSPLEIPEPKRKKDPFLEEDVESYEGEVLFTYSAEERGAGPLELAVSYQGCSTNLCFPPETRNFALVSPGSAAAPSASPHPSAAAMPSESASDLAARMLDFKLAGRAAGYLNSDAFVAFLDEAEHGDTGKGDWLAAMFGRRGWWIWLAVLLILVFGAGLNLTPCVLPMIPINIAIIGAGAAAGSRRRGAALGGTYGAAIAIVYGVLGLAVVLTGSRFGALNASPLFNLAVAVVFVVLALAMFDVITIDLSRFQGRAGSGLSGSGSFLLAFFMGGISALLAGACVAPVLISVLLLSTDLYARGAGAALLLPFLLGLGMALPWPFMGAGLSFLPRPGRWMERVKIVFGIIIMGFALYYGHLAYRLHADRAQPSVPATHAAEGPWLTSLQLAMERARAEGRPILVDFWASWCKNCIAMDKTTFRDSRVINRLDSYVKVKFRAEDLKDPPTKEVLDIFGVIGLPTYVVLTPK